MNIQVPGSPEDLVVLANRFPQDRRYRVALLHFERFTGRGDYGVDLVAALRDLIERGCLTLLIQSHAPMQSLVPGIVYLSPVVPNTVELRGRSHEQR